MSATRVVATPERLNPTEIFGVDRYRAFAPRSVMPLRSGPPGMAHAAGGGLVRWCRLGEWMQAAPLTVRAVEALPGPRRSFGEGPAERQRLLAEHVSDHHLTDGLEVEARDLGTAAQIREHPIDVLHHFPLLEEVGTL
jgi:hypothetical protein